jgi:hypothetical protein
MKKRYYYFIIILLLLIAIVAAYLHFSGKGKKINCQIQNPDPDGYLVKICKYLEENKNKIPISPAIPSKYNIERISEGSYQGREVFIIELDCCYMGDIAYIDKETKEVIGFELGDV